MLRHHITTKTYVGLMRKRKDKNCQTTCLLPFSLSLFFFSPRECKLQVFMKMKKEGNSMLIRLHITIVFRFNNIKEGGKNPSSLLYNNQNHFFLRCLIAIRENLYSRVLLQFSLKILFKSVSFILIKFKYFTKVDYHMCTFIKNK